jgi:hypothetical protein
MVCKEPKVQTEIIGQVVERMVGLVANFEDAIEAFAKAFERLSEAYSSTEDRESPVERRRRLHS